MAAEEEPVVPVRIGRYRVEKLLGVGGFSRVYQAFDEQLGRHVAIKVLDSQLLASASDEASYLAEARLVAQLDHPNILPVYDVGSTKEFPCFVVSRLMQGDLADRMKANRLSLEETAVPLTEILAQFRV